MKLRLRHWLLALVIALSLPFQSVSVVAAQPNCANTADPTLRFVRRPVTFYFGTATIQTQPPTSRDVLTSTDRIPDDLRNGLNAGLTLTGVIPTDPRVLQNLSPFIVSGLSGIEWALGTDENLPAEANLRDAYAALQANVGGSVLTLLSPSNQSTRSYFLGAATTVEIVGGVPELVTTCFIADVTFIEQNAIIGGPFTTGATTGTTRANDANNDDEKPKETKEQRRNRERTNTGNQDDEHTEGNVIEVGQDAQGPFVVLANRDGPMKIILIKDAAKLAGSIKVGDYIEVDGQKEHEKLFYADEVSVSRH
jgi:hypothetical protein